MRRNNTLLASVAVAAVATLLGACSESSADSDDKTDARPSTSRSTPAEETSTPAEEPSTPAGETSAPAEQPPLPDGVLALPGPDAGEGHATLGAGRYRVALDDTLAFDVDVPDGTAAHDDGLFLAIDDFILKVELAGDGYGVPIDPCTKRTIAPIHGSVDDLVAAFAEMPPFELTRPEPARLGGASGTYVQARIPRSYDASDCADGTLQLPGNQDTAAIGPVPYLGRWWVLDVEGQRVVVQQNCWGCTTAQLDGGDAIIDGITFTPTP